MKNDDYQEWLNKYKARVEQARQKDNVVFGFFHNNKEAEDEIKSYYEWVGNISLGKDVKSTINVSVSSSLLDRLETALARVDLALDRLLGYLHEKKTS